MKPEYLMCRVWGEETPPVLVFLIYRPPDVSFHADSELFTHLRDLSSSYSHKIIMGNLNVDLLVDSTKSRFIKSLVNELSLKIIDHGATICPPGSIKTKTWIDLICVDNNDTIASYSSKVPPFHNCHNLIDVEIELYAPKPPSESFT